MGLSTSGKNTAADAVAGQSAYVSLHTADPGGTGANEVTGGSPAYARKSITWGAASGGVATSSNSPVFDVPAGTTVSHFGLWTAASGGTFIGGNALSASESYGAQGTYTLTSATYTQT